MWYLLSSNDPHQLLFCLTHILTFYPGFFVTRADIYIYIYTYTFIHIYIYLYTYLLIYLFIYERHLTFHLAFYLAFCLAEIYSDLPDVPSGTLSDVLYIDLLADILSDIWADLKTLSNSLCRIMFLAQLLTQGLRACGFTLRRAQCVNRAYADLALKGFLFSP